MRSVIQQSVVLPSSAESLFEMYLDATTHAAVTGFPVEISAEPGASFHAFNKQISGQVLAIVRPYLIVQSWRSVKFHEDDVDSTLILRFESEPNEAQNGRIDLVHLDVPEHDYQDVIKGWQTHYWNPWRTYLENREKEL
jgi:activator of HSP90 ATPase